MCFSSLVEASRLAEQAAVSHDEVPQAVLVLSALQVPPTLCEEMHLIQCSRTCLSTGYVQLQFSSMFLSSPVFSVQAGMAEEIAESSHASRCCG